MPQKQHKHYLEKSTVRAALLSVVTILSARLMVHLVHGGVPVLFEVSLTVFMATLVLFYTTMLIRISMLQKEVGCRVPLLHMQTLEDELRRMDIAQKFVLAVASFLFFWFSFAYGLTELIALASLGVVLVFSIIPFSILSTKYLSLQLAEKLVRRGLTHTHTIDAQILGTVTYILLGDATAILGSIRDVEQLRSQGVHVRFVTEESKDAALQTARALGVAGIYDVALTGKDIIKLSDSELYTVLKTVHVFARIIPRHQERIARVLRKYGETLMTFSSDEGSRALLLRGDIKVSTAAGESVAVEDADILLEHSSLKTLRLAITDAKEATHARLTSGIFVLFSTILALVLVCLLLALGEQTLMYIPLIFGAALVGYLGTIGIPYRSSRD